MAGDDQVDASADGLDLDVGQRVWRRWQGGQPRRQLVVEVRSPDAQSTRQGLALAARPQPGLGELGTELGIEGGDPRLVELVGRAGLAELLHQSRSGVGGLPRLLQQRHALLGGHRADIGAPCRRRRGEGRLDGAVARFLELALGDLGAPRQGGERQQVADELQLELDEAGADDPRTA